MCAAAISHFDPRTRFVGLAPDPIIRADSMASESSMSSVPTIREYVANVQLQQDSTVCVFSNQTRLLLSRMLAKHLGVGDEITFAIPTDDPSPTEVLITKKAASGSSWYVYQAGIGYVSQPKQDKRGQHFVAAEVRQGSLGISTVFLPCELLRDYFYHLPRNTNGVSPPTLYGMLRIPASASSSELRVAFKLRDLELRTLGSVNWAWTSWQANQTRRKSASATFLVTTWLMARRKRAMTRRIPARSRMGATHGFTLATGQDTWPRTSIRSKFKSGSTGCPKGCDPSSGT